MTTAPTARHRRRDDAIGPALVTAIGEHDLPGVSLIVSDGQPSQLLDAWSGAQLAVLVDSARRDVTVPGRIRRDVLVPAQKHAPTGTGGSSPSLWKSPVSAMTLAFPWPWLRACLTLLWRC